MKGLRLLQIQSDGFWSNFNRYQLWEHELEFVQSTRPLLWLPGRIIHHLRTFGEAVEYYYALGKDYDEMNYQIKVGSYTF